MLYATNRFPGDGTTTQYEISFVGGYLDRAHVKAYVEGADLVRTPVTLSTGNFIGPYTIGGLAPVPVGSTLVIYRDTPKAPIVDFVNGSRLTESNLDTATRQGSFIAAEGADAVSPAGLAGVINQLEGFSSAAGVARDAASLSAASALDSSIAAQSAMAGAEAAAAAAHRGVKAYATNAEAAIAATLLPGGADVEVYQDETRAGARTRYKVQAGALVFVVNLDQTRLDLAAASGASLVGFQQGGTGAVSTTVQSKLREIDDALSIAPRKNHLWQGFFATWQQGHALAVKTTQRRMVCDGVTFARIGLSSGVTIIHNTGTYRKDAVRIQRDNANASTASATMVMNLTQEESNSLVGKTVCVQVHGAKSSGYSGGSVQLTLQYSEEPEQPILNADGTYTSGNVVAASDSFALGISATALDSPHFITGIIPASATQVSVVMTVPFSGTAGADDYVDIEGLFLTEGSTPSRVIEESFTELLLKAKTRYQASLQYGAPRGTNTEQGSVSAIAAGTAATWSFAIDVRFNPPMAGVPQFLFQSPTSGTESRLYDTVAASTINGLAYNLTNGSVMITNNGATTDGRRYLCHWTAQYIF